MKKQATLKELCYEYSEDDLDVDPVEQHAADCLVRIFDFYAIEFFNWATTYKANDRNNWNLTTKELLEIYKKEKNL